MKLLFIILLSLFGAVAPNACERKFFPLLCGSNSVDSCYWCVSPDGRTDDCFPIFAQGSRDHYPPADWQCTIYKPQYSVCSMSDYELGYCTDACSDPRNVIDYSGRRDSHLNNCSGRLKQCWNCQAPMVFVPTMNRSYTYNKCIVGPLGFVPKEYHEGWNCRKYNLL